MSMSRYTDLVKGLGETDGARKTARSLLKEESAVAALASSGRERFDERGGLLCSSAGGGEELEG